MTPPNSSRERSPWLLGVVLGVLYVVAIVVMRERRGLFTDELDHYAQIALFLRGDFRILTDYLTTIPGYHAGVAAILWLCGTTSLDAARMVNAAFGLAAVAGFHMLRRQTWSGTETIATAQFMVLPILAPLFFIVYTDVLALALLLWATLATLKGRHWLSALALAMLVCVRQHEVLWAAFLVILAIWPAWREGGLGAWRAIMVRALPYLLPIGGFLGFWAWNGSISMSRDQSALHPDLSLHTGNPYFALFLVCILLPLQVFIGLRQFATTVRRHPWLLAIPPLLFAGFWWTFHADNPYNTVIPQYYIRNGFLQAVDADPVVRALTGMAATAAACGLAFVRLRPGNALWLYPFAAIFLAASWLIEQRYALVPLALWLVFREHRGRAVEGATFALWLLLAVYGFHGMSSGRFFL